MKSKRNSYEYSLAHCQERAKQRFDYDLSEIEYKELNKQINAYPIHAVEHNGADTQYLYKMTLNGKPALLVYSLVRGRITTIVNFEV